MRRTRRSIGYGVAKSPFENSDGLVIKGFPNELVAITTVVSSDAGDPDTRTNAADDEGGVMSEE